MNANSSSREDLYFALRGGGNNFGIVTRFGCQLSSQDSYLTVCRFDLNTFEYGQMWGGMTMYPLAENSSLYDAFSVFNRDHDQDPKAALILSTACIQGFGCFFSTVFTYKDPIAKPEIFQNFSSLTNSSDTTRITTLSNLTTEIKNAQPDGFRSVNSCLYAWKSTGR